MNRQNVLQGATEEQLSRSGNTVYQQLVRRIAELEGEVRGIK